MAKKRLELHEKLCEILGSRNVYFSTPSGIKMKYPCIMYSESNAGANFADNLKYLKYKRYSLIVIDRDPDSEIPDRVLDLPYCTSDRNYVVSGLNHFAFTLFY